MKIYVILPLVLSILEISMAEDACTPCNWNTHLHCGKDTEGGCAVTGINKCTVELISCRREEHGHKPFDEIVEGKCPADQKKCKPLSLT